MIGLIILNNFDYKKQVDNLNKFFETVDDEKVIIKENDELIDCDIYALCDCPDARNYVCDNPLKAKYYTNVISIKKDNNYLARKLIYSSHRLGEFELNKHSFISVNSGSIENKESGTSPQELIENSALLYVVGNGCSFENIEKIRLLANKTGAAIACSRKVVGSGKMSHDYLIGSSGSKSKARLCIVFGASGAGAFLSGIDKCEKIIAINSDENALIFECCDIAIIDKIDNVLDMMEKYYEL